MADLGRLGGVLDGFVSGTPTIASPIAAEGMHVAIDWGCAITEDPVALANEATRIYQHKPVWTRIQSQGTQILKARFHPEAWKPQLIQILKQALQKKDARRETNFIGRMLRHHHHRSTEFMSRWIEAKNK